jgi:aminopeptidase-like protein
MISEHIPLVVREVPSVTTVYDWDVPLEWNIEDAFVSTPDGERIVDFQKHNLHIVSYSEPIAKTLSLSDLELQLHSLPERPEWIPYRTSYYQRAWGFCLSHATLAKLRAWKYRVEINSSLVRGSLTYGEFAIAGRSRQEILFFTHVCHPSLANDNTSGMAVATALAQWIASAPRRYSYRFVFAPGTIGSLCWLKRNETKLERVRGGLVLGLLGDPGALTYKASRDGDTETDAIATYVLSQLDGHSNVIPFSPYGYDERQLCSPGFNLPVGRLTRSPNGGYPQYHSSADDLALIRPEFLAQSLAACKLFVTVAEDNARYVNRSPKGAPRLGKRGATERSAATRANASTRSLGPPVDGSKSLLDIARRAGLGFDVVRDAAVALEGARLLRAEDPSKRAANRTSPLREAGDRQPNSGGHRPTARGRPAQRRRKGAKP